VKGAADRATPMEPKMQYQPSLLARDDTFFGVCAGLGEDLGFNPNWLRVGFAVLLYFNPLASVAVYVGLGLIVAFSRLVVREPRIPIVEAEAETGEPGQAEAQAESAETETEELPIAA
jgi:phage shock protein C